MTATMTAQAPDLNALRSRVQKLESHNRRIKGAGVVMVLLASGGVLLAQRTPQDRVVEAEMFVVKDAQGHTIGHFGSFGEGLSGIVLCDKEGKKAIELYVRDVGAVSLRLTDGEAGTIGLGVGQSGMVGLVLSANHAHAKMDVSAAGLPALSLSDKDTKPRAVLSVAADGSPTLRFLDDQKIPIWTAP